MRKPKAPLSAWIVEQRKARAWKSEELAQRLGVSDSTVRSWESGRPISEDNLRGLERLFGLAAPGGDAPSTDVGALLERLDRYAELVDTLVAQNRQLLLRLTGATMQDAETTQTLAELRGFLDDWRAGVGHASPTPEPPVPQAAGRS